ncbi:hypothetical protein EG68_06793 [Paragonimus skrjabini miyazakii]|uniref:Uncharacterized protein n=1 Tax=Paragonimus skrjabini miyazakii TaxID=59628 RepID=A0A8S9YXP2_9TREM|nr:hypothetical protein EG68_06793 [Paragonimus skrjabini miyazakii]
MEAFELAITVVPPKLRSMGVLKLRGEWSSKSKQFSELLIVAGTPYFGRTLSPCVSTLPLTLVRRCDGQPA